MWRHTRGSPKSPKIPAAEQGGTLEIPVLQPQPMGTAAVAGNVGSETGGRATLPNVLLWILNCIFSLHEVMRGMPGTAPRLSSSTHQQLSSNAELRCRCCTRTSLLSPRGMGMCLWVSGLTRLHLEPADPRVGLPWRSSQKPERLLMPM